MEWISTERELPRRSQNPASEHTAHFSDWVIIDQESAISDERVTVGYLNTETGEWNTFGADRPKVKNWMPLPEPPK